jgi:asparagine synthase (glutamine-hydrolysing)
MTRAYLYLSDREGTGNGLEVRSPLIDYKLVEYVSALPMWIKYKHGVPKYLLKETLRGIIPDYILFAKKRGFTPPNTFVQNVVDNYQYQFFDAKYKFYNSVLADRLCSLLLK